MVRSHSQIPAYQPHITDPSSAKAHRSRSAKVDPDNTTKKSMGAKELAQVFEKLKQQNESISMMETPMLDEPKLALDGTPKFPFFLKQTKSLVRPYSMSSQSRFTKPPDSFINHFNDPSQPCSYIGQTSVLKTAFVRYGESFLDKQLMSELLFVEEDA